MTDDQILTVARRLANATFSKLGDETAIALVGAPAILAFGRALASDLMTEIGNDRAPGSVLDWREKPRAPLPADASPMSDSDFVPIARP